MTEKLVLKAGRDGQNIGKPYKVGAELDVSHWPDKALEVYCEREWLLSTDGKPFAPHAFLKARGEAEAAKAAKSKAAPKAEEPKAKEV